MNQKEEQRNYRQERLRIQHKIGAPYVKKCGCGNYYIEKTKTKRGGKDVVIIHDCKKCFGLGDLYYKKTKLPKVAI